MERKKLELELNKPTNIEMLFDQPKVGESQYGMYYLYAVRNGDGATEYSFFAPEEVHSKLSLLRKGDRAVITKQAVQKGSKVVTTYDISSSLKERATPNKSEDMITGQNPQMGANGKSTPDKSENGYLQAMVASFEDALVIQDKFNGMANVNQIAITLFIQRTKAGGY